MPINSISPTWVSEVKTKAWGDLPTADNSTISSTLSAWKGFRSLLQKSTTAGRPFTTDIVSTYSLIYTTDTNYAGGVLDVNGDIHFIPQNAIRGQKVSPS